ncbi:hypothetical protein [Dinoroseobacter sp. S375]|uniref:hypothetical protein n=1 Tax=Dinoroseobacter sp. S375 TaxID=3415136 RepID=UPI003C7D678D
MNLKPLAIAALGLALPGAASALTESGNIQSGDTVDLLASGYSYNAVFTDADLGGTLTFTFENTSMSNAAFALKSTTINQITLGSNSAMFMGGVTTTFGSDVAMTAEAKSDDIDFTAVVGAGESITLTYAYGDPEIVGSGIAPEIDFLILAEIVPIPLPAGGLLLGGALLGAGALRSRRKAA